MKPLPDPFTPPAVYDALLEMLAKTGRLACHRCGYIGQHRLHPHARPLPAGQMPMIRGGSVFVCPGCGTVGILVTGGAATRDMTAGELSRFPSHVNADLIREAHDRIVLALCPND